MVSISLFKNKYSSVSPCIWSRESRSRRKASYECIHLIILYVFTWNFKATFYEYSKVYKQKENSIWNDSMHQTDLYLQKLISRLLSWIKWKLEWKDKTKAIHLCLTAKESLIVDKIQSSVARVSLFLFFYLLTH